MNSERILADQRGVLSVDAPSAKVRFREWPMLLGAFVVLLACLTGLATESHLRCGVCDREIGAAHYWTLSKTNIICDPCHTIQERCSLCQMPVKLGYARTTDGRYICRRHVPLVVLDEHEAVNIFRSSTEQLRRIARGEMDLRRSDIPVRLFDTAYWTTKDDLGNSNSMHTLGVSQTSWNNGTVNHTVVMLSGQLRESLAAVSAHEYTHLWINENRGTNHVIEPDTVEGICELAAWKLMQAQQQPAEQARIEANAYTRGRVNQLIGIEAQIGFDAVLDWVKTGTGSVLSSTDPATAPSPNVESATALSVWQAATRMARPARPRELHLDGLFERSDRTVALINGVTVEAGAAAEIRLNGDLIKMMVDTITNRTVFARTNGHPVRLSLDPD